MRIACLTLIAACLPLTVVPVSANARLGASVPTPVPGTPLYRYSTQDTLGQPVIAYISRPKSGREAVRRNR